MTLQFMPEPPTRPELPGIVESADEGDRSSVTDANGTIAHFEMAYSPNPRDRFVFGPPLWQRLPSLVFLGFAVMLGVVTVVAHSSPSGSALYRFIVIEGRTPFVYVIALAAIATFVRSGLLGVIVTSEGVETRTVSLGIPRVKKYRWAQIDRVLLGEKEILLELWNGAYARLPDVRYATKLIDLIERTAAGRGRQITRLPGRSGR
jgi:hypothetical protein